MRKAFTGGACAPGGEGQMMGNNAFTNMLDHMISGGASAQQKAEGYGLHIENSHMSAMEAAFENQQKIDAMANQFDSMSIHGPHMMQPPHPMSGLQESIPNVTTMNDLWDQPTEIIKDVRTDNFEINSSPMNINYNSYMHGMPSMMNNMYMPQMYGGYQPQQTYVQQPKEDVKIEEIEEVKKEDEQLYKDELKELSSSLAFELEIGGNEKMKNSEFVSFLKKLGTGALDIKEGGLIEDPVKLAQFKENETKRKAMENAYREAAMKDLVENSRDPERFFKMEDALQGKEFEQKLDEEIDMAFDPTNLFKD